MRNPHILKFSEWKLNEGVSNNGNLSIHELCLLGRKTSLIRAFIMKESKLNESYNFILQNDEILESLELQVAYDFINSGESIKEGFKDFTKSIFGDEVLSKIKKMPSKVFDVGSTLLGKGKDVWDKSVSGLKEFLAKSKEVISNILEVMRNFLLKLWELIKSATKKVGKFMFTKKLDKLKKIKSTNFSDGNSGGSYMIGEIQTAGTEYSELINKYFKKGKFEKVEDAAGKAALNIKESVVWDSFIGLYSICEKDEIDNLLIMGNDEIDTERDTHHAKNKVVAWVQAIVQWILSPVGAVTEFIANGFTKAAMSTPSAILKGVEKCTRYKHLPTLVAIIGGMVADVAGIKSGLGHMAHESVDNSNGGLFNSENLKQLESVGKLATSALAGYAAYTALKSCPPLHVAFEAIMLVGLVLMFFGWLSDDGIAQDKIPKMCVEFYHWIH